MKHFLLLVCLLTPLSGAAGEDTLRVDNLAVDSVLVYGPVEVEISQGEPTLLLVRGDQQRLQQQKVERHVLELREKAKVE